jgi:glutamate racemase
MNRTRYLGIIDWGIGGIGIYKVIKSDIADVPVIYFSDTGATPYGKMTRRELVTRLNRVIGFLELQGVSHLLLGCNAASTVLSFLTARDMRIEGVVDSAVAVAAKMRPSHLALIGGRRTVLSGVYRRSFAARGIKLRQRIAQPLSGFIEGDDTGSPELRKICGRILSPIHDYSHLLLACTHYSAITPILMEFLSEETVVIDPAPELVKRVRRWRLPRGGTDMFFTTGDPVSMKKAARSAFGVVIKSVRKAVV